VFTAPLNPSCILWGLRSGIVVHSALLNPPPIPGRLTGPSVSSPFDESHTDAVRCIYMPPPPKGKNAEKPLFVSGGEDGRVKLWMLDPASKRGTSSIGGQGELSCIWSSAPINASRESPTEVRDEQRAPGLVDPVVQVRYDPVSGLIVGATEGGSVWVWTMLMPRAEGAVAYRVHEGPSGVPMHLEFDLDPRTAGYLDAVPKSEDENPPTVDARIMLHNAGESHIHRISVQLRPSGTLAHVESARLVAPDALPIQCVDAVFDGAGSAIGLEKVLVPADFTIKVVRPGESTPSAELSDDEQNDESTPTGSDSLDSSPATPATHTARDYGQPYIVAGTQDGWILVWLWDQPARRASNDEATRVVEPLKRWKISKGAVTKVVASRGLVASGTYDGLLQIWDPLASPPTLLRTLRNRHSAPPAAYPSLDTSASKLYSVNNIVLDTDMVVASIGNQVLGWRAGSQKVKEGGKGWKGQVLGKHAASKSSPAKGFSESFLCLAGRC
jgi:WD40 repeat protein